MHSQKHLLRSAYGFTLAELLVAMAAASLIMALVVATYFGQTTTNSSQGQVVAMQQNLRVALQVMEREIMMAGYKPRPGTSVPAAFGIITADADELVISMVEPVTDLDRIDNDSDGTVDESGEKDGRDNDDGGAGEVDEAGEIITIRYQLYDSLGDGDQDLGREELNSNVSVSAIAENIEALEFVYTLADGTQPTPPVSAADLPDIRAIGISILARTEEPSVSGYVDRIIYKTLSGTDWGAYNDAYRRQLSVVTVNRRNF
ncbi:prepilin-type N-terminal cleavage/methylation domain-containing protein [Desulfosudis oleivorans]|uniref:Tfp pilus assembly protein PilW-like protein n=1 Tax=Desulfosudis oleivorans (strain DSM 6200 / JCM 39069 / Hxd3) TaxID=96561 RepID=A8ZTN3_DESOH|nr:prepilin-type N-terminal cleavage/methylation domain-containing protein [Desulfosudis oleivorans]ABW66297.1 Tfp pilus assembly protein PilW-like protein [Desulfosudis oleivorans Hxd3]